MDVVVEVIHFEFSSILVPGVVILIETIQFDGVHVVTAIAELDYIQITVEIFDFARFELATETVELAHLASEH
jgi:hypothetical protein